MKRSNSKWHEWLNNGCLNRHVRTRPPKCLLNVLGLNVSSSVLQGNVQPKAKQEDTRSGSRTVQRTASALHVLLSSASTLRSLLVFNIRTDNC